MVDLQQLVSNFAELLKIEIHVEQKGVFWKYTHFSINCVKVLYSRCSKISNMRRRKTAQKKQLGLQVIKLEFILRLIIKRNDWLLEDTCPKAANHWALF